MDSRHRIDTAMEICEAGAPQDYERVLALLDTIIADLKSVGA